MSEDDRDLTKKGFSDNTTEILHPDPSLADNVGLWPSRFHPGKSAAVAEKSGNQVCWNCFKIVADRYVDLMMGNALVRFCDSKKCHAAVAKQNDKREALEAAGRIIQR
jgi:hypothetical protein